MSWKYSRLSCRLLNPNETPTFSSKATNRSSCGTAEVFPFADCNSRHGSTRMQPSHKQKRCGSHGAKETDGNWAKQSFTHRTHQNSSELHDLKKSNLLWFKEQSGMGLLSMGLSFHVAENSFNPHAKWAPFSFQSPSASISGDLRSWCTLAFTAYVGEQKPPQITNLLKRHLCASSNSAPSTTPLGTFSVQTHQHSPHLPFAQHASGFFQEHMSQKHWWLLIF